MHILWGDRFKINIASIDAEHQMFVMLIKKIEYSIRQNEERELLIRFVIELKEFARFHFASEENLMLEIAFPDFEAHEKVHSHLLNQLELFTGRIHRGVEDPEEAIEFIWTWFERHVIHMDKDIGIFLAERNIITITESAFRNVFQNT